jgi:hypothetical protein
MANIARVLARLDALEAAVGIGHNEPSLDDEHDRKLPTVEVAARYSVTTRTVERWSEDAELGFPAPIWINRRKFWSLNALRFFDRERARMGMRLKPPPIHPDHKKKASAPKGQV